MRVLIAKAATPGCLRPLSVVVALGHMETGRGGGQEEKAAPAIAAATFKARRSLRMTVAPHRW